MSRFLEKLYFPAWSMEKALWVQFQINQTMYPQIILVSQVSPTLDTTKPYHHAMTT